MMPRFIASYDLKETRPDPHEHFLTNAIECGWSPWIVDDDTLFTLPNTTLQGSFVDQTQAVAALNAARAETEKELGITVIMEKWIVAQSVINPAFDSNEKEKTG
ncbi:hypothetical protein ACVIWV_006027 [Bradyrhizobium diazoefficiens]|uniref:hypothetical protein n=1 Tax=Bradyrhizobium TaxID=374 RepID=UPI000A5EC845|nr:hypothetical protein [Bradyrhizobium diazoefficiens]MBR0860922.1 hypothetical protein [Bradyrhizobium diazoefficiens]MBR0885545.1 hypothetical protein [Bradyrhizobium diazoefficiens]MBR0917438.1 hypothetical protein [Bradyrhizobium diazoefficiens]WLA65521.1 hypothetical protein QNN01_01075 [Bradyrhizobium diazoefficiens]